MRTRRTTSLELLLRAALPGALVFAGGCAALAPRPEPRVSVTIPAAPPATPPTTPAPAPVPTPAPLTIYVQTLAPVDAATRQLLAYHERVMRLPPAELGAELARLGDGSASVQHAMELASALGYTRAPGDTVRALVVLDQVLRDRTLQAEPWHPLARLLAARYAEQRRVEEVLEKSVQQLRDTQRDTQRRLEQLNEKLEALRAIERSLNARQPASPGPAAPPPSGKPAP